ncbi:MAG TPA: 30S ribosomal protein S3 [Clostridiales bacterium]|nr:30S ribosomal protein S3 [Clostridiales bacterium]
MGQKVNPHGLRLGIIKDWDSKWYADKENFAELLLEDYKIRQYIKQKLYTSGISRIVIERAANNRVKISIDTAKPGMVIGKGGAGVEELKKELENLTGKSVSVNINEIKNAEADAQLIAENVAFSLERRISFRRAMKQAIQRALRAGVEGVKIAVSGRLGGAEMARTEKYSEGNVPLHTLRANIDYGFAEANTTYGKIGVKVWINHGEVLPGASEEAKQARKNSRAQENKKTDKAKNQNLDEQIDEKENE